MELGALKLPRLPAAAFLRRTLLRLVFAGLLAGSAALVLQLLADEKQRLQRAYETGFRGQLDVVLARLRHPSGELALLNLDRPADNALGAVPLRLPLGAIDFDDPAKAERAIELTGCALRPAVGVEWCPGVGRRARVGAFVYAVLRLPMGQALGRQPGQLDLQDVHRLEVQLHHDGLRQQWLAPVELSEPGRGQIAGFLTDADRLPLRARPDRDFRGWLWQEQGCAQPGDDPQTCARSTLLSLRIPVDSWRAAARAGSAWPPEDLSALRLRLRVLGPAGRLWFDNASAPAAQPSLAALADNLRAGETLTVLGSDRVLAVVQGAASAEDAQPSLPWLQALVRRLPAARVDGPLEAEAALPGGLRLVLQGDLTRVDRQLAATASRYSIYFGALAGAMGLAWLLVELGLLRRMALLTRRANALSVALQQAPDQLPALDVADLRGRDELGILAGTLQDLLARAREHLRREQLRAHQEREQWQAVGHEIMSPLQSLMALHTGGSDVSRRYLERMQAALQLLYGQASVGEAMAQASAQVQRVDLAAFLRAVAANAPHAGIDQVQALGCERPCDVHADPLKLEDALTHLLTNAQRYRTPGTPILLKLSLSPGRAQVEVVNQGPRIAEDRLATLFELGTSDRAQHGQRGQGLFVARGYLAKMGGEIAVRNLDDGVCFTLQVARHGA